MMVTDRLLPAGKIQAVLRPLKLFTRQCRSLSIWKPPSREAAHGQGQNPPLLPAGHAALGLPGSPRLSARPPRPPARSVRAARVVTLRPGPLALPLRALLGRT